MNMKQRTDLDLLDRRAVNNRRQVARLRGYGSRRVGRVARAGAVLGAHAELVLLAFLETIEW